MYTIGCKGKARALESSVLSGVQKSLNSKFSSTIHYTVLQSYNTIHTVLNTTQYYSHSTTVLQYYTLHSSTVIQYYTQITINYTVL